jgi:PPE-repeat protein
MWAQDVAAMFSYTGSSAAATQVTPFTAPPQISNAGGMATQAAAVAQAAATPAGSVQSLLTAAANPLTTGNPLLNALGNLSTDYTDTFNGLLNGLFGSGASGLYTNLFNSIKTPLGLTTGFNDIGLLVNLPASQFLKFAPHAAAGAIPREALGAGLGGVRFGAGNLTSSVSAGMGNAGTLVGKLSVPPSWATATPAIRTVAAALSAAGPEAVPAAALGQGGLFSSMAMAGMLGSALGAGAPNAVARNGVRGRLTPLKDLKDNKQSPEQLKRLVAQISEKPESVQHHSVDQEGLDGLLEQLAKKPGIHAVHLKKRDKAQVVPSDAQLG